MPMKMVFGVLETVGTDDIIGDRKRTTIKKQLLVSKKIFQTKNRF
jgi:hypothetical protein